MAKLYPGVIRAQVVFQGSSGLPRDRYVNVFHFKRGQAPGAVFDGGIFSDMGSFRDEIGERLREFYLEPTADGNSVQRFLSNYTLPEFQIRCYDLGTGQSEPREAWVTYHERDAAPLSTAPLPFETAVTMSFFATRNLPRNRGRIFLGPLNQGALSVSDLIPTVAPEFRATLRQAAERLAAEGTGDIMDWSVLSTVDNEPKVVTGGWIDNDFDTIRGRGPRAGARSSWDQAA